MVARGFCVSKIRRREAKSVYFPSENPKICDFRREGHAPPLQGVPPIEFFDTLTGIAQRDNIGSGASLCTIKMPPGVSRGANFIFLRGLYYGYSRAGISGCLYN